MGILYPYPLSGCGATHTGGQKISAGFAQQVHPKWAEELGYAIVADMWHETRFHLRTQRLVDIKA